MSIQINGTSGISGVDGTAGTPALQGTDSNTGISFGADEVNINTGGTTRATVDSSGRVLVGTSSARDNFYNTTGEYPAVQIEGTDYNKASLALTLDVNTITAPRIVFGKTRGGSIGSNTIVQSGDQVGVLSFQGSDGTNLVDAARIQCEVDGTPGADDMPGRLVFSTTADGASSPTERMRINGAGDFICPSIYNGAVANAANVYVASNGQLYRSTSSIKYKTDVETLENSYADALLGCRPVWYRSLNSGDNPEHGYYGFIAEEVAEIDPRLVHWKTTEITYDEKGSVVETPCDPKPEGVQYDRFVPHLLNLIKRQGEAIAELQAEVAALKAS